MEFWDIYDINKKPTGRTMKRNDWCLKDGEYHLTVLGVVARPDGTFLITKRVMTKAWAPGWWEVSGGAAQAGESSYDAVLREVKEETGLDIKNVKLCGVKEWFKEGVRCMVFFYKTNCFSGTLQSSEEGEVFWAPADKISEYPLANDFENNLELFYSEEISELFYGADEARILKKY